MKICSYILAFGVEQARELENKFIYHHLKKLTHITISKLRNFFIKINRGRYLQSLQPKKINIKHILKITTNH